MAVYKSKEITSDGRCWFFKTQYSVGDDDTPKVKVSKKYLTKTDAMKAEHDFLIYIYQFKNTPIDMTFEELFEKFLENRKEKVKFSTYRGYQYNIKHFKCFMKTKCVDYNIQQFESWRRKESNNKKHSTRQKNDLLKFWKSILNFGTTWYNFNFTAVYRKMLNFTNPNEPKKEMKFYTLDEFNLFLSNEDELKYKCLWETLFYCGLRCGEARGLTWDNIDFNSKTLTVCKQVSDPPVGSGLKFIVISPKTKTSNRKIPICDLLFEDLKKLKQEVCTSNNFSNDFYVFGINNGELPFNPETIRQRKAQLAISSGLKVIRLHDFRHSCASLLINNGANVTVVAKYLGHSEIEETLNTYSHMFPSALDNVMNIVNNLDNNA